MSQYADLFEGIRNNEKNEISPLFSFNSSPSDPNTPVPSEEGKALLQPFLPVIIAAHRGELPPYQVDILGKTRDLDDYICRLSAEIWYGIGLDDPQLSDRLENLRRLQEWYEGWIAQKR